MTNYNGTISTTITIPLYLYGTSTSSYLESCCRYIKLRYVLSNHISPIFFGLPLLFYVPCTTNLSHLLFTCPNHLNLTSLILTATEFTHTFSWITSFKILSLLICPHIHLNICISATCIF